MSNETTVSSPSYSTRSSSDEQEHDRPERMRDWLIRMINSKKFPGLEYLDAEKTIFKVPWIHAKKRGYNRERDAALFKEWAVHSGKYRDESDPTVWKINFRCAINGLKDIVELKDLQTEDCRVYKVLPRTRPPKRRRRSLRSSTDPYQYPVVTAAASTLMGATSIPSAVWPTSFGTDTYPCQYQQNMRIPMSYSAMTGPGVPITACSEVNGYYCTPSYTTTYSPAASTCTAPANYNPSSCIPAVSSSCSSLAIRREESPDSGYGGIIVEPTGSPIGSPIQSQIPSPEMQGYAGSPPCGVPSVVSTCSVSDPTQQQQGGVMGGGTTAPDDNLFNIILDESSPLPHSPPLTPPSPSNNQINVTIYYGTIPVLSKDVTCTKGCRIFYGPNFAVPSDNDKAVDFETACGPLQAEQVPLPPNHPLPQAKDILASMARGIFIEVHDGDVYATPLCNNIVFCGSSFYHASAPLERERRVRVFDYNSHFRQSLEQYSYRRGMHPDPHVIFSLGQPWGPQQPISQNYISIIVTHSQAKRDLEVFGQSYHYSTDLFSTVPDIVDVRQANATDLRAESFLNTMFQC